jgi:two-component system cell cycle response regulator CpdR
MKHILLVDDDDSLRIFLKKALETDGFKVTDFDCGEAAKDFLLADNNVVLMLTDIVMPGMDGFELSKIAKDANPDIKIMYMSGFSAMESQADDAGAFVSKPFHLNDIVNKVRAELN